MLIIFEWESEALIQANPIGLRRIKWGSNSLTYLLISKGFWRPKASHWGGMIQEDPRRQKFWSPPILAKIAPDRRTFQDDSNGVRFTSNGLHMRKLSHSVVLMKHVNLAKWRCHVAPLTGWHMASVLYKHDDTEPMTGWHMASVRYGQDDMEGVWTNRKTRCGTYGIWIGKQRGSMAHPASSMTRRVSNQVAMRR